MSWGEEPHRRKGLHGLKTAGFGAWLVKGWRACWVLSQHQGCAVNACGVRQKSFLLWARGGPWYLQAQVQEAKEALHGPHQGLAESVVVQLLSAAQRDDTHAEALSITSQVDKAWSSSLSTAESFMKHKGRQVHCFFFHLLPCWTVLFN